MSRSFIGFQSPFALVPSVSLPLSVSLCYILGSPCHNDDQLIANIRHHHGVVFLSMGILR